MFVWFIGDGDTLHCLLSDLVRLLSGSRWFSLFVVMKNLIEIILTKAVQAYVQCLKNTMPEHPSVSDFHKKCTLVPFSVAYRHCQINIIISMTYRTHMI